MAFYKVTKIMKYTETVYIEADSQMDAENKSGSEEGEYNQDDWWYDADAFEISKEEYFEATT